jgi:glycosyltransferase involved in cell wall biosynthesis
MVEKKAPDLSLMAFSKVASRNVDASLTFVGDGPLLNHCRKLARKLGVSNRVFLLGAQSQDRIHDLMQRAGVFVQHSVTAESGDTEGLPVAILEAMASGLPVISTWHSGIPEAVEDGVSGLLVAERDVEGMGQAMLALAENPDVARRMGQAGREIVIANFGVEESISYLRKVLLHERP